MRKISFLAVGLVFAVCLAGTAVFLVLKFYDKKQEAEQQRMLAENKTIVANNEQLKAEREKCRAEQQTLAASYNLSKAFEEKALTALKLAEEQGDINTYKKVILFTSGSLAHNIEPKNSALEPASIGKLFAPKNFKVALTEQWYSPAHQGDVMSVSFSPDGKTLASASDDKTVRLWNIESEKEIKYLEGYDGPVTGMAFSPDGRQLASASYDETVRLLDIRLYTLFLHKFEPTPLYRTFIEAVKFLWQLDVQDLEIVHKNRTPADMEKFGALLASPPPGQSKFDQVLAWAEQQQEK